MWADDMSPFNGKHYQLAEPMNHPQPLSKPHPPILIGGAGEKKTLRLVAQYADACNLFAFMGIDELSRKLDVLKSHCDDVGRDYDTIERTVLTTVNLVAAMLRCQNSSSSARHGPRSASSMYLQRTQHR